MSREMIKTELDWAGLMPKEWRFIPNRFLFQLHHDVVGEKWTNYELLSLTTKGVKEKDINASGGKVPDSYDKYQIVNQGDMIFCLFDLDVSAVFSGLSEINGMITSAYDVAKPNHQYITDLFSRYWFQYVFSNRYYKIYSKNVRYTISADLFKGIKTPVPPIEEQISIGTFLEEKIAKIDELIQNQEKQIELLEQEKINFITKIIEEGIDNELIDSPIKTVLKMPKSWKCTKLLNLLEMKVTDGPHETPELFPEGVPFVSAEAIKNWTIDFNHIRGFISKEFYDYCCLKYIPRKNDIYVVKSGASTGKLGIVNTDKIFTIWSPLAVVRVDERKAYYKFVFYALYSRGFQKQIQLGWSFGTQQNLGMRTLETLKIQYPASIDEQKKIASYIDSRVEKIDRLIKIKQGKIEKLQEYKKSLIYEYVTGKKEV